MEDRDASVTERAAVEQIRQLHRRGTGTMTSHAECAECEQPYPCPTVKIIDAIEVPA